MLKSYKTEINPTPGQKQIINRTIGVCRYVYNFYLAHNRRIYKTEERFISGMDFSKWLNNEFIPNNSEFHWIKDVSSKSIKQSIMNAERAVFRKNGEIITIMDFIEKFNATCQELSEAKASCVVHRYGNKY